MFPEPSSNVHVITEAPGTEIGKVVVVVPVIVPMQLSVAVGAVTEFTSHMSTKSGKLVISAIGAIVSASITFCNCDVVFPCPSLYVQVTTVVPGVVIGKATSGTPSNMPPQLFVAVGVIGVDEHCPVISTNEARSAASIVGVHSEIIVTDPSPNPGCIEEVTFVAEPIV